MEELYYFREIDFYILDLNIFCGKGNRELKDIIVVSNTCGKYCFNLANGIPVKEFKNPATKTDICLYALRKYFKDLKGIGDVRPKLKEDFINNIGK